MVMCQDGDGEGPRAGMLRQWSDSRVLADLLCGAEGLARDQRPNWAQQAKRPWPGNEARPGAGLRGLVHAPRDSIGNRVSCGGGSSLALTTHNKHIQPTRLA